MSNFRIPKFNNYGQTLVEVMVAIFIIVIGLMAILSLLVFSLKAVRESENRVTAANFAREGIEVVRNIRDSNWLYGCPVPETDCKFWNDNLSEGTDYTSIAEFEPETRSWSLKFGPNIDTINDAATKLYRNSALDSDKLAIQAVSLPEEFTQATSYSRLLTLNPICANGDVMPEGNSCPVGNDQVGIDVKVLVKWTTRNSGVTVEEKIYNWR